MKQRSVDIERLMSDNAGTFSERIAQCRREESADLIR